MATSDTTNMVDGWPPRPPGEVFPEVMTTVDVAMFLRYDAKPGVTPDKARRNVRKLVKDSGLPTLGRIGSTLMYRKNAIIEWLAQRDDGVDNRADDSIVETV